MIRLGCFRRPLLLYAAGAVVAATTGAIPAFGCSFSNERMSTAEIRKRARASVRDASAIIDAEVRIPMYDGPDVKPGLTPVAYLRVIKVFKGGVPEYDAAVVYTNSCDIGLTVEGQKVRILLVGEGVFRAEQPMNGGGVSDIMVFNTEVDRIVGKACGSDFARFPGEEPPPL